MKKGASPNTQTQVITNQRTGRALRAAAQNNALEVVDLLLTAEISTEYKGKALIDAATHGHLEIVNLVLTAGVSTENKGLALMGAAPRGHLDVVNLLLTAGVSTEDKGWALVDTAACGRLDVANLLLIAGISTEDKGRALINAINAGKLEMVNLLLTAEISTEYKIEALKTAASWDNLQMVNLLLERGEITPPDIQKALTLARQNECPSIVAAIQAHLDLQQQQQQLQQQQQQQAKARKIFILKFAAGLGFIALTSIVFGFSGGASVIAAFLSKKGILLGATKASVIGVSAMGGLLITAWLYGAAVTFKAFIKHKRAQNAPQVENVTTHTSKLEQLKTMLAATKPAEFVTQYLQTNNNTLSTWFHLRKNSPQTPRTIDEAATKSSIEATRNLR